MRSLFVFLGLPKKIANDPQGQFIQQLKHTSNYFQLMNWLHDDLHKWTWYVNLLLTLIPIYVIWKLIDRRRLLEILVYGLLLAALCTFLDSLGLALNLWDYPDRLLPTGSRLFPVDLVGLPVFYMLVYQYFRPWGQFILANVGLGTIMAFVGEPLFIWLNFYNPVNWKLVYSFPIYVVLAILAKWFTGFLVKHDLQYNSASRAKSGD